MSSNELIATSGAVGRIAAGHVSCGASVPLASCSDPLWLGNAGAIGTTWQQQPGLHWPSRHAASAAGRGPLSAVSQQQQLAVVLCDLQQLHAVSAAAAGLAVESIALVQPRHDGVAKTPSGASSDAAARNTTKARMAS